MITYIAKRSLMPSHIDGAVYNLPLKLTSWDDTDRVNKSTEDMLNGNVYTIVHSANKRFAFNTQIIKGALLNQMIEFIDSVKYGEVFEVAHPDTGQIHQAIYQNHSRQRVANRLNEFRYSVEVLTQS